MHFKITLWQPSLCVPVFRHMDIEKELESDI